MKLLKKVLAVFTASVMFCMFSGSTYSDSITCESDISRKISESLLSKYGVSREDLKTAKGRSTALMEAGENKVSAIVWCTEDIDYEVVEKEALPVLANSLPVNKCSEILSKSDLCLNDVLNSDEELSNESIQEYIETKRYIAREMYEEINSRYVEHYMSDAEIEYISLYSPAIVAELTLGDVLKLASLSETDSIVSNVKEVEPDMLHSFPTVEEGTQLSNYGYTGDGVKIGQVENFFVDKYIQPFSSIHYKIHTDLCSSPALVSSATHGENHANMVASIIIGQSVPGSSLPKGIASDAEYYSVSVLATSGVLESIEWLISQGVNVINMSAGDDNAQDEYEWRSKWIDHIAIDHNVHIVICSGNEGKRHYESGVLTGGVTGFAMAYNAIVVGNLDHKTTENIYSDDEISPSSSFYSNGDLAYKPDLCAPGTNIKTLFGLVDGTSFSTPHVTGAVALLCEAKPILKLKQDVVKAILTAAINPHSPHKYCPSSWTSNPTTDCYSQYGAGLLDVYESVKAAMQTQYCYGNIGHNQQEDTYYIYLTAGNPVRISLAYLKNNTISLGNHFPNLNVVSNSVFTDLDLYVYAPGGNTVAQSITSHNNVEIVEFTPNQTGMYVIRVHNFSYNLLQTTQYGLCWVN